MPSSDAGCQAVTCDEIVTGLRKLGLQAGKGVMVHSSLKSFGIVSGGAQTVIEALMEILTPDGTLLMPSFNHGTAFEEGMPGYFHPRKTATINGAIPDLFWIMPDVRRSLDPTHAFAAWGKHSQRYTQFHHRTLTMGPQSPLGLLHKDGGFVLLLGVSYGANTFHHVVEMTTGAPCLGLRTEAYPVALPDGRVVQGRTWGWREDNCPLNDHTVYQYEMQTLHKEVIIGQCRAILFRLQDCFNVIARLLREGKNGIPPCNRCPNRPRRVPQTVPSDWDSHLQRPLPDSLAWTY
jgi:aminoglycoside 3-N-acetyltransferase